MAAAMPSVLISAGKGSHLVFPRFHRKICQISPIFIDFQTILLYNSGKMHVSDGLLSARVQIGEEHEHQGGRDLRYPWPFAG